MSVLTMRHAGFAVQGRPLLRDIDLDIRAGEVVALVGANGSGKSTLVKAAVGLNRLTSGELLLFDEPIAGFRGWSRLGYVPQRSSAAPAVPATVGEVVASGRLSRKRALLPLGAADRRAVTGALAVVGLEDRRDHPVGILSGGQQQRVLVARALAGEPELLVLDEPNAGVDHGSQQALADALADRARHGTTILVVLHELGPFAPLITRLLVMADGRLVHDGAPEDSRLFDTSHVHHHHPDDALDAAGPMPAPPLPAAAEGER